MLTLLNEWIERQSSPGVVDIREIFFDMQLCGAKSKTSIRLNGGTPASSFQSNTCSFDLKSKSQPFAAGTLLGAGGSVKNVR